MKAVSVAIPFGLPWLPAIFGKRKTLLSAPHQFSLATCQDPHYKAEHAKSFEPAVPECGTLPSASDLRIRRALQNSIVVAMAAFGGQTPTIIVLKEGKSGYPTLESLF